MIIEIKLKKMLDLTPLHYAAQFNSKEIKEVLISKGADINAFEIIYLNIIILFSIKIIYNKTPRDYNLHGLNKDLGN